VQKPWSAYLVDAEGNITFEFGVVCAALVLLGWLGVAAQGSTTHTSGVLHRCASCNRATTFQRRPGAWVAIVAGLSWGALLWTDMPSAVRWLVPGMLWGVLVVLHPKRCALCRAPMGVD
jgi:hypothetical protein